MTADASWLDSMPEFYDRCLGPALFAPYAREVAAAAAARAPRSVLELAAGTGIVTAELVRQLPAAHITATDLNAAMVAWAAQRVSGPTWRVADAGALEFPDASFDLVVCQFGVMFFPDKPRAFAEAARVLRPGGEFLFTVWDRVETMHFAAALVAALTQLFPDDPPDFVARIPHGYHDTERLRQDLAAGGLAASDIERLVLRGTALSARTLVDGFCYGTPLRFALQERGDVEHFAALLAAQVSRELGSGPIESDLAAYVVRAHPG
jgi:SAM-dependent methyltransferase